MLPDSENRAAAILVVDDDEFILEFVRLLLARAGYQVLTARSGREAWAVIEKNEHGIRLLLTDVVMPGSFDGFELAARARNQQPDLPILLMTGAALHEYPPTVLRDWEPLLLRKPFSPDRFLTFVQEHLDGVNRSG